TADSLIQLLFGRHEASFFGLNVPPYTSNHKPGLLMDAKLALSYFANPGPLLHVELSGDVIWNDCISAGPLLLEALEKGWFAPSMETIENGIVKWTLRLPEERKSELDRLADPAAAIYWFNAAFQSILASTSEA